MEPQVLNAGKLRIKGSDIRYEPPASLNYEILAGQPILFQLHYAYEEDSSERENCIVRFRVSPEGTQGRSNQTSITDTPVLKDQVQGILEQAYPGPVAGDQGASFEIDAFYERRAWLGLRRSRSAVFNHRERFQLKVRAPRKAPEPVAAKPRRK